MILEYRLIPVVGSAQREIQAAPLKRVLMKQCEGRNGAL